MMRQRARSIFLVGILFSGLVVFFALEIWPVKTFPEDDSPPDNDGSEILRLQAGSPLPEKRDSKCLAHSCFDIFRCTVNENKLISVYVYPFTNFLDESGRTINKAMSQEFYELLTAIMKSKYYTTDLGKACIIVPSVDTLNQNGMDIKGYARILASLPSWENGRNHLLFNMLPGGAPDYNSTLDVATDKAILAGGGFATWSYRMGYDVSIPVFNALTNQRIPRSSLKRSNEWTLVSSQTNMNHMFRRQLEDVERENSGFLILKHCADDSNNVYKRCKGTISYHYPDILQRATFCLVIRGVRLGQTTLLDALMMGCIPVVVSDDYILPFSDVLDWKRAAVLVVENEIKRIPAILKEVPKSQIADMRRQGKWFWDRYFNSMGKIALTTLRVLNDRVYRYTAWRYEDWNAPFVTSSGKKTASLIPPLFFPLRPYANQGFTAVVLCYDRVDTMFKVITKIADTPSLTKIVVVWNNVNKAPPSVAKWPKLSKPVKVVRTKENKLSNRFYPFNEIETEAILAIDDDILMLTPDELEFGFQAWREFPDRVVGFPGRVHTSENISNRYKYESEWTNSVSMVLTGCAFHHKYFSHLFTYMMPSYIRDWVDKHMNCEDIAMNFMVTNYTGKAPIKVTRRKRFRCPDCVTESLWADPSHFVERSECLNEFVRAYGHMPLETVEFRADPLLFGETLPDKLKLYKDIGSI